VPFPTTNWSLLAEASLSGDTEARAALTRLCQTYRPPVIEFLLQRGYSAGNAEDFAQEFFLRVLQSRAWKRANRAKGRFRTFLLGTLMHVVGRERARDQAECRGGGVLISSLDELGDNGFEPPSAVEESDVVFDRAWATQLMALAMTEVARPFLENDRPGEWAVISRFLPGAGEQPSYEDAAAQVGLSPPALKTAIHRVRQRFREELRAAIARTVSAAHEIDDELAYLHRVLSSPGA
jgi:DNA-directed RNA polymerase specialized sigma24 family protein